MITGTAPANRGLCLDPPADPQKFDELAGKLPHHVPSPYPSSMLRRETPSLN